MHSDIKYVVMKRLVLGICLSLLVGCSWVQDMGAPHVFGNNEVPTSVLTEPRLVRQPDSLDPTVPFPQLGSVPSKPSNFTPQPMIDQTQLQMEQERDEALEKKRQLDDPESVNSPQHSASSPPLPSVSSTP